MKAIAIITRTPHQPTRMIKLVVPLASPLVPSPRSVQSSSCPSACSKWDEFDLFRHGLVHQEIYSVYRYPTIVVPFPFRSFLSDPHTKVRWSPFVIHDAVSFSAKIHTHKHMHIRPLGQFLAFGGIGILNGGEPFIWSSRRLFCCAD